MLLGKHILNKSSGPSMPIGFKWEFTNDGSWVVPTKGVYKITVVGAGGRGGKGEGTPVVYQTKCHDGQYVNDCAGASGGGGGSGETIIKETSLQKDVILNITIGKTSGASTNISGEITLTARGGSQGGAGQVNPPHPNSSQYPKCDSPGPARGYAGSGGNFCNPGSAGRNSYSGFGITSPNPGGSGGVSDLGGDIGRGGTGGSGGYSRVPGAAGSEGKPGICIIEYLGR